MFNKKTNKNSQKIQNQKSAIELAASIHCMNVANTVMNFLDGKISYEEASWINGLYTD